MASRTFAAVELEVMVSEVLTTFSGTSREVGDRLGISASTVRNIRAGARYREVRPDLPR